MNRDYTFFWIVLVTCFAIWAADAVMDLHLIPSPLDQNVPNRIVKFSDVKPVFQQRCIQCHSQEYWNWTIYERAYEKRDAIRNRVWVTRSMPLSGAMPKEERELVRDWVDGGSRNE